MTPEEIQNFLVHAGVGARAMPQPRYASAPVAAATLANSPSVPASNLPVFRSDLERNIAVDSGMYTPDSNGFAMNPMVKLANTLATQRSAVDMQTASDAQSRLYPMAAATNPSEILRSQLAGDSYGDVKQVLQHLQGGDPRTQIIPNSNLKAFVPTGGYGGKPSEESLTSKLDFNVVNDPHFQQVMAQDPKRGAFVYQHLTGRDYATDLDVHSKTQTARAKMAIDFTKDQLGRGAKFNQEDGTWQLLQSVPGDSASALPGQEPRPVVKYVTASPEQAQWMNTGYSAVMNKSLPSRRPIDPALKAATSDVLSKPTNIQDNVKTALSTAQTIKGSELTANERIQTIQKAINEARPLMVGSDSRLQDVANSFFGNMMGFNNFKEDSPTDSQHPESLKENLWGKIMSHLTNINPDVSPTSAGDAGW